MADDPWADFRIKSSAPSAKDEWAEFRVPEKLDITPTRLLQQATDQPIVGPAARGINAAINAALAPIVDPLLPDDKGYEKLPEKSFMDRLRHAYEYLGKEPAQFREQHPVESALANIGGGVPLFGGLGATATGARALGLGGTTLGGQALRMGASGAGIGIADAALRGEDPTTAGITSGLIGAATPAVARGVARAITPLRPSAEHAAQAAVLRGEGVPLTAGAATGNRPLQWAESAASDIPFAGQGAANASERTAEGFTAAALRRAGITANRASDDVINNAFTRIGNDFEGVASRNHMQYDPALGNDLTSALKDYANVASPAMQAPIIGNMVRDIRKEIITNGGHLTGEQYNSFTSRLARIARTSHNDPQLQAAAHDVRDALDQAFERTLERAPPGPLRQGPNGYVMGNMIDLDILRNARRQYRNMLVIERAATGPGSDTAKGLISPSQLRNATIALQGRRAFARGQGDFTDLARAGEAVLKPLPQSGTAPRAFVMGLAAAMHDPTVLMHTVGAARLLHSRPVQAWLGSQRGALGAGPQSQLQLRALMTALAAPQQRQIPYFPPGP